MTGSARRWWALAVALVLVACAQFQVRGVEDPCPGQTGLAVKEVDNCWRNQATILVAQRSPQDLTAGGRLRGAALPFNGRAVRHVVALDYSGSMYGGYERDVPSADPTCGWSSRPDGTGRMIHAYFWQAPGFSDLLRKGPLGGIASGDPVHPLLFNRDVLLLGAGPDEVTIFDTDAGRFPARVQPLRDPEEVLRKLTAAPAGTLPGNPYLAGFGRPQMPEESRLGQVLDAAGSLFESFGERDGILWIVTDNIIEQVPAGAGGSDVERDVRNNRQFYHRLEVDPRWQVVYAWPVHRSPWLCGSTLIVYGLYYSSRERIDEQAYADLSLGEAARLGRPEQIAAFGSYASEKSPSPGGAFKLKPEYLDVVRISFAGQIQCPPKRVGESRRCRAKIRVENLLHHRQIDSAYVVLESGRTDPKGSQGTGLVPVRTALPFCAERIHAEFRIAQAIAPRRSVTVPVDLDVPAVLTERRSLGDIWENAKFEQFQMVGSMRVAIRDLHTSMAIRQDDLSGIYGVEALPEIFRNPGTDNLSTSICLVMPVENPSFVASLLLVALGALVVATVGIGGWLVRPLYRTVLVDGDDRGILRLTRLGWSRIAVDGQDLARARLRLSGTPKLRAARGHSISSRGGSWEVHSSDGFGVPRRISLVPPRRRRDRKPDEF